ncbi:glutathione S-transferase D4-like [Culicoides brevitarsis]|uniref:glutathione S-transferase D4-like n=1 Tax=Culicoides brevitarsis TaxID=469753 RepID=UPI00307C1AAB
MFGTGLSDMDTRNAAHRDRHYKSPCRQQLSPQFAVNCETQQSQSSVMSPILYYMPEGAPSRGVLFLVRYLNLDVQLKVVRTYKDEHKDPAFLKLNPAHTVPVLEDNGLVLVDSQAIAVYLIEQYATKTNLFGNSVKERALVLQRLFFNATIFHEFKSLCAPIITGAVQKYDQTTLKKLFETVELLEIYLKDQDFVAGKYVTVADFFIVNNIITMMRLNMDLSTFKHVNEWIVRMKTLTGFQECDQGAVACANLVLPKLK